MRKTALPAMVCILVAGFFSFAWASGDGPGITADEALKILKSGNKRFVAEKSCHPHQDGERRAETASKGQHPFVTVLTCSDSRVPPEVLFDSGIGDIFVIRVAGNVAGVNETASIEYAVEHLKTPVLVVLGHTKCGAVTAAATNAKVEPNIAKLLKSCEPAIQKARAWTPGAKGEALVPAATTANVWQAVSDVYKASPIIAKKAKEGKLKVLGAIYDVEHGTIDWMENAPE
ncbi:MAG: carbonic anhydrase [Pseudomonadota bacterium]